MLTNKQIEDRYRKQLERLGYKMHKTRGCNQYYVYEIGGDDSEPGPGEECRYMDLMTLGDFIFDKLHSPE